MTAINIFDEAIKGNTSWQMEVLMEKLRNKAGNLRSLTDYAKMIKQSILNKQHILDPGEKVALGQCLDKLQESIKVTLLLSAMVERLEATARQLGLQFTSGASGPEVYISCDMFYVEVHLQTEGKVRDVKVELAGDQHKLRGQSSPELVECLSNGNFTDFMAHLEGFLSIYKLNTEKKNKCKAYQALQALELDLLKLFEMAQETISDTHKLILKSPVGLLINRKGGHPVKMIYFNSPYELLDVDAQKSVSLTYETASAMDLSHLVSVNIEASVSHKLQTTSLVNIIKGNDGLKLPSISGLNSSNSVSLPAYFVLRLKDPMAISYTLACKISEVTGITCFDLITKQPLLPLIIRQAMDVPLDSNNNKGLFVTLPDQQHCYFMPSGCDFEGVLIHRVPFTHPTSVAHILDYLRMQAVFNSLITSCVRPSSKQELESAFIFEVSAVTHEFISVTFEHPEEESTATAELDLTDLSNVRCRLFTLSKDVSLCSDEYATKVLQRCLSIPVTMRAVIRKVVKEEKELPLGDSVVKMENNNLSSDPNQNTKFLFSDYNSFGVRRDQVLPSHGSGLNNVVTKSPSSQAVYEESIDSCLSTSPSSQSSCPPPGGYSSLMAGSLTPKNQFQHHFLADGKSAKVRKRKSPLETERKSPKFGDDIVIEVNKKGSSENLLSDVGLHIRRDVKFEKVTSIVNKRRSSGDGALSPTAPSDLAALREKVYGAASAANFAKLSYMHSGGKDVKDSTSKKMKKHKSDGRTEGKKASPIVLDLTDVESTKKASLSGSAHSSALSAALLKRPGIEIIPIPGSNTPISIPSSITVTPVMKSLEDKYKEKKDKRDRKDLDKRDKKRRRDDSPGGGGSSSNGASAIKQSKIQIISTNTKHTSGSGGIASLENLKGERTSSGVTVKSSGSFQSPVKNPSLSPTFSQKPTTHGKVTFSPSHKPNKLLYSPTNPSVPSSSSSSCASTCMATASTTNTSSLTSNPSFLPASSISPSGPPCSSTSTASCVSSTVSSSSSKSTSPKQCPPSPKHSSLGKPSMNALKGGSPTFSKPSSLSPKLSKGGKEREKSCSPSRPSASPVPPSGHFSTISQTSVKSKGLANSAEKMKGNFSEALTITKVSSGETLPSTSIALSCAGLSPPFPPGGGPSSGNSPAPLMGKLSADKAKSSPPKNRKGSSLIDIVDKLRAGVSGSSSEGLTILERKEKEKRDGGKAGLGGQESSKKDADNFMIKTSTGLKFTINKAKASKDGYSSNSKLNSSMGGTSGTNFITSTLNALPNTKGLPNKSPSGLKPGVISGPASKKVSMASLPPIPKLPPASISSITATAISPLGSALSMTSPLHYGRERQRENKGERERDKERVHLVVDKLKKDPCGLPKNNNVFPSEMKKESAEKNLLGLKQVEKEQPCIQEQHLQQQPRTFSMPSFKNASSAAADTVDRALKNMFGEESVGTDETSELAQKNDADEYFNRSFPFPPSFSEVKGKPEALHCSTLKEMTADSIKESTASMPPPAPPVHTKLLLPPSPEKSSSSSSSPSCTTSTSCPIPSLSASTIVQSSHSSESCLESVGKIEKEEPFTACLPPPVPSPAPPPLLPHRAPSPGLSFPQSPSVSIKIVQSPAPVASPLNMISPQSVSSQHSPCIIDDDLMDEAVMGSRK